MIRFALHCDDPYPSCCRADKELLWFEAENNRLRALLADREGKWERIENPYGELEAFGCECGFFGEAAFPYCPSCGRKMSGGEKEIKPNGND